jgi:hypothetical protein
MLICAVSNVVLENETKWEITMKISSHDFGPFCHFEFDKYQSGSLGTITSGRTWRNIQAILKRSRQDVGFWFYTRINDALHYPKQVSFIVVKHISICFPPVMWGRKFDTHAEPRKRLNFSCILIFTFFLISHVFNRNVFNNISYRTCSYAYILPQYNYRY